MLNENTFDQVIPFFYACKYNTLIFIELFYNELKLRGINIINHRDRDDKYAINYAAINKDVNVIKYILDIMINEIPPIDERCPMFDACECSNLEVFLYLFDIYLNRSIPNQFYVHILDFLDQNNKFDNINEINNIKNNKNNTNNNNNNNNYANIIDDKINNEIVKQIFEENYQKIIEMRASNGNKLWHYVAYNEDLDLVTFIYSLKGIDPFELNQGGNSGFLIAIMNNGNINVIKYLYNVSHSKELLEQFLLGILLIYIYIIN